MMKPMNKTKVKSSFKRHSKRLKLEGMRAEILMWMDYLMFLKKLAKEAEMTAQEKKSKTVTAAHVKAVAKSVIGSCRG